MLSCVIFDMDGVISDSEPLHHIAERKLLAQFDVELAQDEIESFTGMSTNPMLQHLIDTYNISTPLENLARQLTENLHQVFSERIKPIPQAIPLIQSLNEQGIPLAVGSSSSPRLIDLVLDKLDIQVYFKAVVSGHEVSKSKPHQDIFLEIASRLHVSPQECVVIEDSKNGVLAAKEAGMVCVGFESPNSPNQDLSRADWIIDDLSLIKTIDLEKLLESVRVN
ncbi:HAD family phosphatase [candidate division KSB1 bacterium]|nr:HAD family phosphatase [candidate division KSB1 bacterium]